MLVTGGYPQLHRTSQNNYYVRTAVSLDKLSPETQLFVKQHQELGTAAKVLREGARAALSETTVQRALFRLPELKRFLPEQYRNG